MTNTPIAAKLAEALRALTSNPSISLGDLVYTVREYEGLGWDGPNVKAWSDAVVAAREALAEYDTAKGAEPPSPAMEPVAFLWWDDYGAQLLPNPKFDVWSDALLDNAGNRQDFALVILRPATAAELPPHEWRKEP